MTATHIIRVSSNCDTVTIARATARDRRLSFQARGMLLALLAMGDGAETSIDALIDESPAGRDAVYSTLAELRTAGYVDRYAERGPSGKIIRWVTWVREVTQEDLPDVAEPDTAKPEVANYSVTHSPAAPYLAKPEVADAQPVAFPPHARCLIPPPDSESQEDSATSVARRQGRPPTAQQAMFGECADVVGIDLALVDDLTKTNLGKLAAAFIAEGVPLGMPTAAWAAERARIAGFVDGRPISPPTIARLKTLVGAYRKAKADGTAEDLGPGRFRDPITGRLVVNAWTAR